MDRLPVSKTPQLRRDRRVSFSPRPASPFLVPTFNRMQSFSDERHSHTSRMGCLRRMAAGQVLHVPELGSRKQAILRLVSRVYSRKVLQAYDLEDVLGSGNFGVVFLAKCKKTGIKCALKTICKQRVKNQELLDNEIAALRRLDHPNITHLHDVIEDDQFMYILLEYCSGGELLDYLMANGALPEQQAAEVFAQIASAVAYAHKHHIVHRDLKPDNVLLVERGNLSAGVRVSDFGVAHLFEDDHGWTQTADLFKRMESVVPSNKDEEPEIKVVVQLLEEAMTPMKEARGPSLFSPGRDEGSDNSEFIEGGDTPGTLHYLAPEILQGKPYSYKVDAWSLGVILYNLLTCQYPFDDDDGEKMAEMIVSCDIADAHLALSIDAQDLIHKLLEPDVSKRLTVASSLSHPWLAAHNVDIPKGAHSKRGH
eukprot:m.174539 g.174539  ORF g.174539 m.174539 type:complete len:424 (-) comp17330_c0_seq5:188-1459(-)